LANIARIHFKKHIISVNDIKNTSAKPWNYCDIYCKCPLSNCTRTNPETAHYCVLIQTETFTDFVNQMQVTFDILPSQLCIIFVFDNHTRFAEMSAAQM